MSIDYSKLRGRIVEKFSTQSSFSMALGLSERSLSLKMNSVVDWRQNEILKVMNLLEIPKEEIH